MSVCIHKTSIRKKFTSIEKFESNSFLETSNNVINKLGRGRKGELSFHYSQVLYWKGRM